MYKYIIEKASSKIDPHLPTPEKKIQCSVQDSFSEFQSNIGRHQSLRVFEAFKTCKWKLNQTLIDSQKQLYWNLEFYRPHFENHVEQRAIQRLSLLSNALCLPYFFNNVLF